MEIESKLDEDFMFYLGFVNAYVKHIHDKEMKNKCEQWLQKLCGEVFEGIENKRGRNIYLSQLLLCMQNGVLEPLYNVNLNQVDFTKASEAFKIRSADEDLELPAWLEENDVAPEAPGMEGKIGRTYLATRTLPDGQGAFAYIAVSLDDEEPKWLGGGEGVFDRHMEQKYKEEVPEYEMEKILARRKDPKQREKVITFYAVLLQNIEDELDEKIQPRLNETVNGLLEQLENDLRDRGQFEPFEILDEKHRRIELLLILHDRIKLRVNKVQKREELLDEIENNIMAKSFFETSVREDDKIHLPAQMWAQVINKQPNKKNIERLKDNYPLSLLDKFIEVLANYKEEIALRMQRRHENIASQMKRELRREDEKGRKVTEEAQRACDHAAEILDAVKAQWTKKRDAEKRNEDQTKVPQSEHSKLYDEMRAALYSTQKSVEDEAERGRQLAAAISVMNEQTEACSKVNEESVKKIEASNMQIMKNIKRLNAAIANQQERINKVQQVSKKGGDSMTFFF